MSAQGRDRRSLSVEPAPVPAPSTPGPARGRRGRASASPTPQPAARTPGPVTRASARAGLLSTIGEESPAPTPIQAATWPLLFAGRDVIGIAETGSGNTLGFGLPCLKRLLDSKRSKKPYHPTAVIISPTRELAMQIYDQLVKFAAVVKAEVTCIYGGVRKDEQREALKTAAIVVATPGRLKDLQNEEAVNLGKVKYLVLERKDSFKWATVSVRTTSNQFRLHA